MLIQYSLAILLLSSYCHGFFNIVRTPLVRTRNICQLDKIDEKNKANLQVDPEENYIQCIGLDDIEIIEANLKLTTKEECPNQYIGFNSDNEEITCTPPHKLGNTNVTNELIKL